MATRMQQRRGTAAQWIAASPVVLEAGEIGFETDTNQFKIGDGSTEWASLSYFKNLADLDTDGFLLSADKAVANGVASLDATGQVPVTQLGNIIDGAPNALNTLNEIAAALNDDDNFASYIINALAEQDQDLTDSVNLIAQNLANAMAESANSLSQAIATHDLDTSVHGIANTLALVDLTILGNQISNAVAEAGEYTTNAIADHNIDTSNVHGIANTLALVTTDDARLSNERTPVSDSVTTAKIADAAVTGAKIAENAIAQSHLGDDSVGTNEIGGLAVTTGKIADGAVTTIKIADGAVTKTMVGLGNVDNTTDAGKPVSTATQTALDLKANLAGGATFTDTVVLPSTTSIGDVSATEIGYVNGVTSAIQTQLDAKASLSGATFTGNVEMDGNLVIDGDLTVNGNNFAASATSITIEDNMVQLAHQNAANTVDLGIVVGYNDGAAKHSGIVRDVSTDKWKLFKGVTTEPSTTVDFTQGSLDDLQLNAIEATSATIGDVSNTELQYLNGVTSAIQTQIDAKAPIASPTFTGTVTVAESGVAFTDGTQTKEGVPSRTPILQKTASYTLSDLTERDDLIEMASASAMTLTIPTDATLDFPIGTSIDILQTSTGQVTIAGAGGVTVNATPGLKLRTTWSSCTLFKRAANTWVAYGDLSA
jgi:hypothetical protein